MSVAIEKLEDLLKRKGKILEAGGTTRVEKQHASGKLTARERLEYFFDAGTFVEMDAFVQHRSTSFGMDKND